MLFKEIYAIILYSINEEKMRFMVYLNGRKKFIEYFFERAIKKKILLSFMMVCMSIFAFRILNVSAGMV